MDSSPSQAPMWIQFVPLIIFTLPWLILLAFIAKRKGINIFLAIVLGCIPLVNFIFAFYVVSRTDTEILDRLKVLEEKNT